MWSRWDFGYIHFMPCIHFMHETDQAAAQDHAIVLDLPPTTWPTWSKFKASNWLLSIPWPVSWGVVCQYKDRRIRIRYVCVRVCVCVMEYCVSWVCVHACVCEAT